MKIPGVTASEILNYNNCKKNSSENPFKHVPFAIKLKSVYRMKHWMQGDITTKYSCGT